MNCPKCGGKVSCVDSRPSQISINDIVMQSTRRRKKCKTCGYRYTTNEIAVKDEESITLHKNRNKPTSIVIDRNSIFCKPGNQYVIDTGDSIITIKLKKEQ